MEILYKKSIPREEHHPRGGDEDDDDSDLVALTRREGENGPFTDQVTLKTAFFGASNATIRKGKGRGHRPGGSAAGSTNAECHSF